MKTNSCKWFLAIALVLLPAGLLSGCAVADNNTGAAVAPNSKIRVVAAERFYGEVAQAVGGDRVEVTSILTNPQQDPHEYEPTVAVSKSVANAQAVVYTGIGYDNWMNQLLNANSSGAAKQVVVVGSDLCGKVAGDNPHVWYDPSTMTKLAAKLAADFSKLDPGDAAEFRQRANNYITSLSPLTTTVNKLKQPAPALIDVSEPVFDYMAEALNLKVNDARFAKAIEEGNDPAASDFAAVQNDIKNKRIKFFVYNVQTDSPTVDNLVKLAAANGIPVVKVTETEPAGEDYVQWMTSELNQVGKVLGAQ